MSSAGSSTVVRAATRQPATGAVAPASVTLHGDLLDERGRVGVQPHGSPSCESAGRNHGPADLDDDVVGVEADDASASATRRRASCRTAARVRPRAATRAAARAALSDRGRRRRGPRGAETGRSRRRAGRGCRRRLRPHRAAIPGGRTGSPAGARRPGPPRAGPSAEAEEGSAAPMIVSKIVLRISMNQSLVRSLIEQNRRGRRRRR